LNAYETIGYYILNSDKATAGKPIYNPQYVAKVGMYFSRLKLLGYRVTDETHHAHLQKCYQNHLFSAMFWAIYPKDVSQLFRAEKTRIQMKLYHQNRNGGQSY